MFKKTQAKKLIVDPKIALRTERSDPARNSYFSADFLSAVGFSTTVQRLKRFIMEGAGRAQIRNSTDDRSELYSMTHSPGKIEYNCRYFIMTFRTQIHKKKFGKNGFRTLKDIMSHHPLNNTSSLKITAA